jgi:hypothetical protein
VVADLGANSCLVVWGEMTGLLEDEPGVEGEELDADDARHA